MIGTLTVLGVCLGLLAELSVWHVRDTNRLNRRALALGHATNVLEELRGQTWNALPDELDEQRPLPTHLSEVLTQPIVYSDAQPTMQPEVRVRISPYEGMAGSRCRRLEVEVRWHEPLGDYTASVQLEAYRCPRESTAGAEGSE